MKLTEQQIQFIEHFLNVSQIRNEDWKLGVIFTLKALNIHHIRTGENIKILNQTPKHKICGYCTEKMFVGSEIYEVDNKLFCGYICASQYADNKITEGILELSDCTEDDAE